MRTPDVKTAHQLLNTLAEFSPSNPFRSPLRVPSTPVASKRVLDVSFLEPADADENSSSIQFVKDVPTLISATSTPFASRIFNSNTKKLDRYSDSNKTGTLIKPNSNSFNFGKRFTACASSSLPESCIVKSHEDLPHSSSVSNRGDQNFDIDISHFEEQNLLENSNHINLCNVDQNPSSVSLEPNFRIIDRNAEQLVTASFNDLQDSNINSTGLHFADDSDKPSSFGKSSIELGHFNNNTAETQYNQVPLDEIKKGMETAVVIPPSFTEHDENTVSYFPNQRPPLQNMLTQQTFIKIQRPPQIMRANSGAPFIRSLCPNKIVPEKNDQVPGSVRHPDIMKTEYSSPNLMYKAPDFNRSFSSPISADKKSPLSPRVIGSAPLSKIKFREHSRSPIATNKSPSLTFKPFERSFGSPIAQIENSSAVTIKRQRPSIFEHPSDRESLRRIQNLPKKKKFGRLSPVKPSEDILPDVFSDSQMHSTDVNGMYPQAPASSVISSGNFRYTSRADEIAAEKCELFKSYSRDMLRVKLRHAAVQHQNREMNLEEKEVVS